MHFILPFVRPAAGRAHVRRALLALGFCLPALLLLGWASLRASAQAPAQPWQEAFVLEGHGAYKAPWSPWSPDGSKLVTASFSNTLEVWDAITGVNLATLSGHTDHVRSAAWSPDGSKLASASDDGSARIWDAATGDNLSTLTGHAFGVDDVAWSPDSSKLASASGNADGTILVWDAATGAMLATLTGHTHYLQSLAWSPDGSKLASASSDQSVRVWDAATGATLATITNNNSLGTDVAWSPDGSKVASASGNDGDIGVWDAATGANLATLTGHTDSVESVAWSPDGSKLASAAYEGTVRLWDAATGASLATVSAHDGGAGFVAWSPDGSKLVSVSAMAGGDETVRVWDGATGASLAALSGHTGAPSRVAWSPDSSKLVSEGDNTVRIWAPAAPALATATPVTATPASTAPATATPEATTPATATPAPTLDPKAIAFDPAALEFVWEKGSGSNPASQKVVARNVGGTGWSSGPWVKGVFNQWLPEGMQMDISVTPANANLPVGVHESDITLTDKATGTTITLPVKLTVVSADGALQVNRKQLNFGGFVGDPIADQGVRLSFTGLNSSKWSASGPPWLTLAPASGSVSATAPTTLTVGIDSAAVGGAGQYTGTLTVSDGKTTHEIAVEVSLVAPGSPTIQLFGLEVTQGIQNLLNDIPLVADRPAFVRGHVRSLTGAPVAKATAQLIGTRDGVELGRLNPINPGGSIDIGANPNRAQLNESFLFELPESWRTGTVTLRLEGKSQPIACVDPAEQSPASGAAPGAADDCTVTLTYEDVPALPIRYFLYTEPGTVTYSDGRRSTATFTANADHANATSRQLLAGLPIPRVDQQIHPTTLTFPGTRDSAQQPKMMNIMSEEHQKAGQPLRHYYGLFARYATTADATAQSQGGPGGVASVPGFAGFGEYYTFLPMDTLNMHEIGHNLGREHVDCGDPASPDPKFPHPDQQISDVLSGDAAYYGFNIVNREVYPPTNKDLMSYCQPSWVSPYTYQAMLERLKIHYVPATGTGSGGQTGAAPGSPVLLVSGLITGTAAGSVDSVADDNAGAGLSAPDGASEYSVRLEDANGQEIGTYPVTPQTVQGQNEADLVRYTLAVPRPENLARVVLLHQGEELAARAASANAPTLTLTTPEGGEQLDGQPLSITWSAGDDDGDPLTFNIDYSLDDGATWWRLASNLTETALEIDSAWLPGSSQARIRVSANDGFLTTFAQSETFTVADQPPVATILTTELNRAYVGGQAILLEGAGYDLEDGMVSDLTWVSDRDGLLGTGPSLWLEADNLAEGPHVIRLEATDSAGQSSFGDPALGVGVEVGAATANDTIRFAVFHDPLSVPAELADAEATAEATEEATADATAEATEEAAAPTAAPPAADDRFPLLPGQAVEREQKIVSESGNHYLFFQPDGNLVVYTADDQFVWGLESVSDRYAEAQSVLMQADGNFAVYGADDEYLWSALTENPDPSAYLTLTPEGVLRLVSGATGDTLWASDGD